MVAETEAHVRMSAEERARKDPEEWLSTATPRLVSS